MTTNDAKLCLIEEEIRQLYHFRNAYFVNFNEESFRNKNLEVNQRLDKVCKQLDDLGDNDEVQDKASQYYLKGWLLNIKNDYDKDVFDLLTKSIKLRPDFCEAWIELGECYFKKGDIKLALNCFETVLKKKPEEKKALRNASIMLRSLPCSAEEKTANVLKSIELAKKAVECDLKDGDSWAVLGNAYLTRVFMTNRTEQQLSIKNCKSAYQKAILDKIVATKADVLFNYANILQYEEEFEEALKCLSQAAIYDSEWRELKLRLNQLIAFFGDICQKTDDASCLSAKKLNTLVEKVKSDEAKLRVRYADCIDMCNGHTKQVSQLVEGSNECLLVCKVLSHTIDSHNVSFCSAVHAIDSSGQGIALFVYDIAHSQGVRSGDLVVIVRPLFKQHRIQFADKMYEFRAIKVVKPLTDLYVNHKRLGADALSIPTVNVTLKSE